MLQNRHTFKLNVILVTAEGDCGKQIFILKTNEISVMMEAFENKN